MCLAIPGEVIEISANDPSLAVVNVMGLRRIVDLGLLDDNRAQPGDWVLIHVGYAMSKISKQDAEEQIRMLEILGEKSSAFEEAQGYGLGEGRADPAA